LLLRCAPANCSSNRVIPAASGSSRASGPARQPPEPTSFATKKTPEGLTREGQSKLTPSNMQSVRTEQPDDAQASSAPRHLDGPRRTTTRPSWTPAHVDRRLEPSNHLEPDLSHYIRDKVGPRGERIPIRSLNTQFHSIRLHSAPRARQPGEGHRESPLHRIPPSPSSPMRGRLHWRRGNIRISTKLTPYQSSSSFTLCCNLLVFGCS
jgi:hypothetical protein